MKICEVNLVLSSEKNLYEILEIPSNANAIAIKGAYRKLARKYHPDLNSGDAACIKKFKEISEAYEVLSNIEKKKNYDLLKGFYQENSQAKRNEANKAYRETQKSEKEHTHQNPGFSNVFNDILEGFKSTTSSKRQGYKSKPASPERGSDVSTDIVITMFEAMHGATRIINILHTEKCPNCEGRKFLNESKCPLCKGLGEQSIHKKLTVKIPPNVKHGSKIRIANEGNKGYNGGKNGDLYLNIKVESNSIFRYDGNNILCTIPITPAEAALGVSINVPAPGGNVLMKVLPNTQSGQKYRLSGQGAEQNGKIGDMIVTVNIELPKKMSQRELELYKELQNIENKDTRKNLLNDL